MRDRRWWLAALLTLGVWGLGHVYAGRLRQGIVLFLMASGYLVVLAVVVLTRPGGLVLGVVVAGAFALGVAVVVHAGVVAARAPRPFPGRPYNRWWVYVAVLAFSWLVWQPAVQYVVRDNLIEAFRIPSSAMEPTILVGDYLFADKRAAARTPERDAVVIYDSPVQPGVKVIKRIIGVAGDTLAMRDGVLLRNGGVVRESWVVPLQLRDTFPLESEDPLFVPPSPGRPRATLREWGPFVVPQGQVFVAGDNRPNSWDSRYYGPIPADRIVGRPVTTYFSLDTETFGVRWSRIGGTPWVPRSN